MQKEMQKEIRKESQKEIRNKESNPGRNEQDPRKDELEGGLGDIKEKLCILKEEAFELLG